MTLATLSDENTTNIGRYMKEAITALLRFALREISKK